MKSSSTSIIVLFQNTKQRKRSLFFRKCAPQYLRSVRSNSQDVCTAILKKGAPQMKQSFESCSVLFVSDMTFDVWGNCDVFNKPKTTWLFLCRISKGEQKDKIIDVEAPPILMASRQLGHIIISVFILHGLEERKASGGPEDVRIWNNWRANAAQKYLFWCNFFQDSFFD